MLATSSGVKAFCFYFINQFIKYSYVFIGLGG
jgi:hypothetical protein